MRTRAVLVVEDDAAIRRGLVDALGFAGYDVLECDNGTEAADIARASSVDLVLLDVMLPGADGFEVLDRLRKDAPSLPVIMVTARGAEEDRVRGLKDGADDYVVKPFSAKELLARVDAVLRRVPEREFDIKWLLAGDARIDLDSGTVTRGGSDVRLTEREVAILRYLHACAGRPVDRNEMLQRVWRFNPQGQETRTVDMHVARLRDKIEDDPSDPQIIVTVRGKGYMLSDTVKSE